MGELTDVLIQISKVENATKELRSDFEKVMSGSARDRKSQKESVWGRLDMLEEDVGDLKKTAEKAGLKAEKAAGDVEKYRAGFFIAVLGSFAAWVVNRLLGSP